MKKSLFAIAAVTAFAGAAQAQSSVTVYGLVDGGYNTKETKTHDASAGTTTKTSVGGFTGNAQASSRIGFRGIESLGGGTSATFNLELGITPGTGAIDTDTAVMTGVAGQSNTGVRTSVVGLTNQKLGSVNVGRQLTGIHTIIAGTVFAGNNMVGDLAYQSQAGGTSYATNTRVHLNAVRMNNSVAYVTPTFSGFSARADYSADRSTTTDNPNQVSIGNIGLSAAYVNGPFTVRAGYHAAKGNNAAFSTVSTSAANTVAVTAQSAIQTTTINAVSARYGAKDLTVEAIYANNKTESIGVQLSKVNSTQLNVSYAIGAITPFIKYGMGSTETGISGAANADTSALQVGALYAMSKRTNLYAAYGQTDIKVKSSTTAGLANDKTSAQQAAVGLMHTF
jgi:predicted porin